MSLSFVGIKPQAYIGVPVSIPLQIFGVKGRAIKLSFAWQSYGGGSSNQNIAVQISLAGGGGFQPAYLLDFIRSVYIDNTGSAVPIFVQFTDTLFTVAAQPYSVGWYPVFTNGMSFTVAGQGFTNANLGNCLIYVTNVPVNAFTDVSLQAVLNQALSSPVLGGGSGLLSIVPVINGQDYNNGNISITGGGGVGGAAHGIIDQWGRFTAVVVDNPGTGFIGSPVVTATGGQTIPAQFNQNNTYAIGTRVQFNNTEWQWNGVFAIQCGAAAWVAQFYFAGSQVNYLGNIYRNANNTPAGYTDNPVSNSRGVWTLVGSAQPSIGTGNWLNSGTAAGTQVTFNTVLTPTSTPIITSGFAAEALGDQATNVVDTVTGVGVFRQNIFGSPFASGFIYLTHFDVEVLSIGAGCNWTFGSAAGYTPFDFQPGSAGRQLSIQKANIKLDATQNWQLNCIAWANSIRVSHGFVWTYSQN